MTTPWTPLHAQLHQILRRPLGGAMPTQLLCPKGQRMLVAVSGGQDSLCLMQLLLDLQPKWGWELAIAHCNHRWRSDSDANAAYVAQLAKTWQVPGHTITIADDERNTITTEAGARVWRYQVLTETAIAHNYAIVITGHTASDRAETLLYNLMRGSGSDGLQALTWRRSLHPQVQLVRPLLFLPRSETGRLCKEAGLMPWIDRTNDDWHYARNRIRQDLLPYLQEHFNPNVEKALAQTAEILHADVAYLEAEAQKLWETALLPVTETNAPGFHPLSSCPSPTATSTSSTSTSSASTGQYPQVNIQLQRQVLATAPVALQRRVMRRCLLQILPRTPTFDHIEMLTALITAPNRSQTAPFPGGAIAYVKGDKIIIDNPAPITDQA